LQLNFVPLPVPLPRYSHFLVTFRQMLVCVLCAYQFGVSFFRFSESQNILISFLYMGSCLLHDVRCTVGSVSLQCQVL